MYMEMQKVKYCQDSLEEEQSWWTYTENIKTLKKSAATAVKSLQSCPTL